MKNGVQHAQPLALSPSPLKPQWVLLPVPIIRDGQRSLLSLPQFLSLLAPQEQPSLQSLPLPFYQSNNPRTTETQQRVFVHIPTLFLQSISVICSHHHLFALITVILLISHIVFPPPSLHSGNPRLEFL